MERVVDQSAAAEPGNDVDAALGRLVANGTLSREQADAVRRELDGPPGTGGTQAVGETSGVRGSVGPGGWTAVLAEVGGYVGGAFIAAAAAVLAGRNWAGLGTTLRIAVLALPAVLLLIGAGLVARTAPGGWRVHAEVVPSGTALASGGAGHRGPAVAARRRLVAVFTVVAAALVGGAGAVIQDRLANGHGEASLGFISALVVVGVGYAGCRCELLHLATAFTLVAVTMAVLNEGLEVTSSGPSGWAAAVAGLVWLGLTLSGVLDERGLGLAVSGVMGFFAGEMLTGADPKAVGYLLLAVVAGAGLLGYVWTRLLLVLIVGVVTLAVLVPQVILDVTDGALGASGALLVVGVSIISASVLGLRLRRDQ